MVVQLWWLYTVQTLVLVYILTLGGALSCSLNHITVIQTCYTHKHTRVGNTHTHDRVARVIPHHYQNEGKRMEAEGKWIMWEQSRHLCGFTPLTLWLTGMFWPKTESVWEGEREGRNAEGEETEKGMMFQGSGWRGTDGKKRKSEKWEDIKVVCISWIFHCNRFQHYTE